MTYNDIMIRHPYRYLAWLYLGMTVLHFWAQILLLILHIETFLSQYQLPANVLQVPPRAWIDIGANILYQVLIWLGLASLCFMVTSIHAQYWRWRTSILFTFGLALYFLTILTIYLANDSFFPQTSYAVLVAQWLHPIWAAYLLMIAILLLSGIVVSAVIIYLRQWSVTTIIRLSVVCLLLVAGGYFLPGLIPAKQKKSAQNNAPNVILIGLDSLRASDFQDPSSPTLQQMPFLQQRLQHSVVFNQGITPLARTLPAWVSVLSGAYPVTHGVRFDNQLRRAEKIRHQLLSDTLQRQGYMTLYVTDDTQFSPVSTALGFDQVIAPRTGFNNFLLSTFAKQPIVNLLANTWLGRYLFPYHYLNRAISTTYQPHALVKAMDAVLTKQSQPIFLSMHLCLAHWPYIQRKTVAPASKNSSVELYGRYLITLQMLDQQLKHIWQSLQRRHLLDNSIVLIFNDHGEGLGLATDRIQPQQNTSQLGHGTDVLNQAQTQIFLAWQMYQNGSAQLAAQQKAKPSVSLVDIKPTLNDLLQHPVASNDGMSLKPYFSKHTPPPPTRILLTETGYLLPKTVKNPVIGDVVRDYVQQYRIDPRSLNLELPPQNVSLLLRKKQRAAWQAPWLLAIYPSAHGQTPLLVNTQTRLWTTNLASPLAKHSPASKLFAVLKEKYSDEIYATIH